MARPLCRIASETTSVAYLPITSALLRSGCCGSATAQVGSLTPVRGGCYITAAGLNRIVKGRRYDLKFWPSGLQPNDGSGSSGRARHKKTFQSVLESK